MRDLHIMLVRWMCVFLLIMAASLTPLAAETPHTTYGTFPLVFEPNQGQSDESVRFLSHGNGYGLFLTDTEALLAMARPASAVVRMKLIGQKRRAHIEGIEPEAGVSHYFRGANPVQWQKSVPQFLKVKYRDVYPGIDLQYYGNQRQLEYDFNVAPGGNPSSIELGFSGVNRVSIGAEGDLVLDTDAGILTHRRPLGYQERSGARVSVAARFILRDENRIGFDVDAYDESLPLVIDPALVYSTYFGGTDTAGQGDQGNSIAVDSAGNAYITGFTSSTDLPLQNARQSTP